MLLIQINTVSRASNYRTFAGESMIGNVAREAGARAEAKEARRPSIPQISTTICLRGGKPYVPCTICADNCPVDAINFGGRAATVAESCLGCGLCSVTCPAGAVDVTGFDVPPNIGGRIHIECSRVPSQFIEPETWTVPCIAGLSISDVVAAAENQKCTDKSIVFVDRGLCGGCPVACNENKIASAHTKFSDILRRTHSDNLRLERIERPIQQALALPSGLRPPSSRRAFLRSFIAPPPKTKRLYGIQQERDAIARLAASAGHPLDASFYPAITVSEGCEDHGVCAASCPTGALRREMSGASGEIHQLLFDATQCIACGRCAEVCPRRALSFAASGAAQMQSEPVMLRETRLSVCPKCEEAYRADDIDNGVCPACRKNNSLFADLFLTRRRPAGAPNSDIAGTV